MPELAIVNDERNILDSLRLQFEGQGLHVETYHDPLVALPKLILVPPQLRILNGRMPNMQGIDFFERFREFSRAPAIFLSAWADEIEEVLADRGRPANCYVTVPFSLRAIAKIVRGLIG